MKYCPNCENILEITRSIPKVHELNTDTPTSVSSINTSDKDQESDIDQGNKKSVEYDDILKKLENEEDITEDELKNIDIDALVKSQYYKKLANKGKLKKKLMDMIDDMTNSDTDVRAYHICNKCGYNEPLENGYNIITKISEGTVSRLEYEDLSRYRNYVYYQILPRTRNFRCKNKDCKSLASKDTVPSEAVFFRKPDSYQTLYICTVCHDVKMN